VPHQQNVDCRTFRFAQRATARENFWRLLSLRHTRFALVQINIVRTADIVAAQRSRQNVNGLSNGWSACDVCGARCRCRTLVAAESDRSLVPSRQTKYGWLGGLLNGLCAGLYGHEAGANHREHADCACAMAELRILAIW
jgi:hypothetical protein